GDQGTEEGAPLKEGMPVFGGTSQSAHFQAQNHADMSQRHFAHQTLKATAPLGCACTLTEVFIDSQHALAWPAARHRVLGKSILPCRGLTMLQHLLGGGLARINDGKLLQMVRLNLR